MRTTHRQKIFIVILVGMIGALVALGYRYQHAYRPKTAGFNRDIPQPGHRVRMDGLRFFSIREGRKAFFLEATSFAIEKKKIGFFRTGLAQTARIINGRLVIFIEPGSGRNSPKSALPGHPAARSGEQVKKQVSFPDLFSHDSLKNFPVPLGRIASIEVEPVSITLMEGDSPATTITASTASLRLRSKDIHFSGNVLVTSGRKTLRAGELTFDLREGIFKTDQPYRMTAENDSLSGERLRTDIFLQSLPLPAS